MKLEFPSLLITDDDRDFRTTLCDLFEDRGYHTIEAADGQEALDILERQVVHLLLVDMHMPRLTGLETLHAIRKVDMRMPFILLSAAMDPATERQARAANAFQVLSKPVRLAEITRAVQLALDQTYGWNPGR